MNCTQNPFALLRPKKVQARGEPSFLPLSELKNIITNHAACELVIDLETRGTNPAASDTYVVGIGVSSHWGTFYSEIDHNNPSLWYDFIIMLYELGVPLVAHNVAFDALWLTRDLHRAQGHIDGFSARPNFHNWYACTYAVYRWLASEGFIGQKYGLKQAMVQLLGWPQSNEEELDKWLISNDYKTSPSHADKSQMWRAPAHILGKYCWYDAEATYLIWAEILKPVMEKFSVFDQGYRQAFMSLIEHVVWQKLRGVHIDLPQLECYRKDLDVECASLLERFYLADGVRESVQIFNAKVLTDHSAAQPKQYKKPPELGKEPSRWKGDGTQSKNWEKWEIKRQLLENHVPEITIPWKKWHEKHQKMTDLASLTVPTVESKDLGLFNIDSAKHKQWLFYQALNYEVTAMTDGGEPAVDEDALLTLRPHGPMLIEYNARNKIRTMVQGCLDKLDSKAFLHVGLKCPGTYTGRLGGADGLNLQNVAKDRKYLECWTASPGCKLVIFDVASLEPHVLAVASGDPTLMRLYGPESTGWDCVYLSVGAQLGGRVGEAIRATGYDPFNNTKDSVSKAKKEAKEARNIAKLLHLSSSYGAGPGKIRQGLALQGVDVSMAEAKSMHSRYWELFAAVKDYEKFLLAQWERSGGWFINPIGRPICVAQDYTKDIVNRSIQSAGHDCFVLFLQVLSQTLSEYDLPYAPYIWDVHDCVMLEVPEDKAVDCKKLLDGEVLNRLNYFLNGAVKLKGDANVVDNWAQDKFEG